MKPTTLYLVQNFSTSGQYALGVYSSLAKAMHATGQPARRFVDIGLSLTCRVSDEEVWRILPAPVNQHIRYSDRG